MMRRILFPLLFAFACAAQQPPGSVRGVVASVTGEPLRKVQVSIRPEVRGVLPLIVETDASGAFTFPVVPPGKYRIAAKRIGFLEPETLARYRSQPSSREITVATGATLDGVTLTLMPHGVISGRVTDQDGDPVLWAQIEAMKIVYKRGRALTHGKATTMVNDLGEYRIVGLAPGRYTIVASPPHDLSPMNARARVAGQESAVSFVPLYFPGVLEPSAATPVQVEPGQELRGIDFRLRKEPIVNIRGHVVDGGGNPVSDALVTLWNSPFPSGANVTSAAADGSFLIAVLASRSYTLVGGSGGRESRSFGATPVQVGTRDLDNVVVRIAQSPVVSGALRAEGTPDLSKTRIAMEGIDTLQDILPVSEPLGRSAAFRVTEVIPGTYRVGLLNPPEDYYVKSVRWNGQDLTDKGLLVTTGLSGLELTLAKGAPMARGVLVASDGAKIAGGRIAVVPPPDRRERWDLYKEYTADQDGSFTIRQLPPGDYEVFGFTPDSDAQVENPAYLQQIAGKGKPIQLKPGEQASVEVQAIE